MVETAVSPLCGREPRILAQAATGQRAAAEPLAKASRALPAYFGGKRRLVPIIFALINERLPRREWPGSTFLDPFCGGGATALAAKAHGFRVVAADSAERAAVVARALIANSSVRLNEADVLDLFRAPGAPIPRVAASYAPGVFKDDQASFLDLALARAGQRPEPLRSLLLLLIIKVTLRCQPMSMLRGTDARAAATGDFDRVSPRRLGHYLGAVRHLRVGGAWRIAEEINGGVFGGRGEALKGDAREVMARTNADVVYLDPPYPGTTSYNREYAVLDALLGDQPPARASPSLDELIESARHIPLLALSFGGPTISLEGITTLVGRHRKVFAAHALPYRHLGSIASEKKNVTNRELLLIAGR